MPVGPDVPFNWEGVSVATSDTISTVTPTWTRLDNAGGGLRVNEILIRRGRSDEFERNDTGKCTVSFRDRNGDVDPTNIDLSSRPLAIGIRNPVTDTWHPRFRGTVDDHEYDLDGSLIKGDVTIAASDAMARFTKAELAPGIYGDTPDAQSAGYVQFDETGGDGPQERIEQVLGNYGWATELQSIFTGNVYIPKTVYSPGESVMTVISEACDAELPNVGGQFYIDKYGVVSFHGRFSRIDPSGVSSSATHWDYNTWSAGTTVGTAQMRPPFTPSRSTDWIRNIALCYPFGMAVSDRDGQVAQDGTSVGLHGPCSWSAENLRVLRGNTSGLTGPEECLTYAQFIVDNYKDPLVRIDQITIKSLRPDDPRATETWAMLCGVDLNDTVTVTIGHPGGGGFAADFFVEGITERITPLQYGLDNGFPMIEMTLDLSPAGLWANAPEEWTP
jgi:hypothetical protein